MTFPLVVQLLLTFRGAPGGLCPTAAWRAQEFRQLLVMARSVLFHAARLLGQLRHLAFQCVRDRAQMVGEVSELFGDAAVRHAPFGPQTKVGIEPHKSNQRAKGILLGVPARQIPAHAAPNVWLLLAADRRDQTNQVLRMFQVIQQSRTNPPTRDAVFRRRTAIFYSMVKKSCDT